MERIRELFDPRERTWAGIQDIVKVFFDPLATTRAKIQVILERLPVGSAHPFSTDGVLLCRTAGGIEEIDISTYPEEFFFNAIDLGELGETLQRRMAGFQSHLGMHTAVSPSGLNAFPLLTNTQQFSMNTLSTKRQPRHSKFQ